MPQPSYYFINSDQPCRPGGKQCNHDLCRHTHRHTHTRAEWTALQWCCHTTDQVSARGPRLSVACARPAANLDVSTLAQPQTPPPIYTSAPGTEAGTADRQDICLPPAPAHFLSSSIPLSPSLHSSASSVLSLSIPLSIYNVLLFYPLQTAVSASLTLLSTHRFSVCLC